MNDQKINENPLVSIIIPVYNGSNYLKEAIESALVQTYSNIEVIVVNDGSDDDGATDSICRSFGNRIQYFSKENRGVSTALNFGISKMHGEYFSWLSHDDLYLPDKIKKEVQFLFKHRNYDIVYCNQDIIDRSRNVIKKIDYGVRDPDHFLWKLLQKSFINICSLLIPKKCFLKVGNFDEIKKTMQDFHMMCLLAKYFKLGFLKETLINIRHHEEQGQVLLKTEFFQEKDDVFANILKNYSDSFLERTSGLKHPWYLLEFYFICTLRGLIRSPSIHLKTLLSFQWSLNLFRKNLEKITSRNDVYQSLVNTLKIELAMLMKQQQHYLYENYNEAFIKSMDENILGCILQGKGSQYKKNGLYNKAIMFFTELLRTVSDKNYRQSAYFHLGTIFYEKKMSKKSIFMLRECLKISPNHQKAKRYLSKL